MPHRMNKEMAQMLVDALSADVFDPSAYRDGAKSFRSGSTPSSHAAQSQCLSTVATGRRDRLHDLVEALKASATSANACRSRTD
jgi:non-homologous end joining protein Ku